MADHDALDAVNKEVGGIAVELWEKLKGPWKTMRVRRKLEGKRGVSFIIEMKSLGKDRGD